LLAALKSLTGSVNLSNKYLQNPTAAGFSPKTNAESHPETRKLCRISTALTTITEKELVSKKKLILK
jgi:hypothetical protein